MNPTGHEGMCKVEREVAVIEQKIRRLEEATERYHVLANAIFAVVVNADAAKSCDATQPEPVNHYLPDRMEKVALQIEDANTGLERMLTGLRESLGDLKIIY